jgi:hypothetical protein
MDMKLTAKQRHAKPSTMRQVLRGDYRSIFRYPLKWKGKNFEED